MRSLLSRALRRLHRVTGSVMALVVAMWFASGLAMMFVSFPRLSDTERIRHAAPLEGEQIAVPTDLRIALDRGAFGPDVRVRIAMAQGRPLLTLADVDGTSRAWPLRAGTRVPRLDAEGARREAIRLFHAPIASVGRLTEPDQWTVPGGLAARLPLFRVSLSDARGTELYFTESTGELVQKTTRKSRLLAWLGPIPHWIYPTMLRAHRKAWRTTILVLVSLCFVVAASGLVNGLRVRTKLARRQGRTAIRDRWLRLHQSLGLALALPLCTWLASGAFSLSLLGRFGGPTPTASLLRAVHGRGIVLPSDEALRSVLARCEVAMGARELELFALADVPHAICRDGDRTAMFVLHGTVWRAIRAIDDTVVRTHVARAYVPSRIIGVTRGLVEDDFIYADHHDGEAHGPYVRIAIDDARRSTVYVDIRRGIVVAAHTRESRLDRWLYQGLHCWDPAFLRHVPRLRYVLVGAFMVLGCALSLAGFAMAIRRARRSWPSGSRRPPTP